MASEDFKLLSPDLQTYLHAWYTGQGVGTVVSSGSFLLDHHVLQSLSPDFEGWRGIGALR
jgi:hypothetical protein